MRSKSLLYSLGVHCAIFIVAAVLIYKSQAPSCTCGSTMQMTKLNLASLPLEEMVKALDDTTQEKKVVAQPKTKPHKELKKFIEPEKPATKQVELKDVEPTPLLAKKTERVEDIKEVKNSEEVLDEQNVEKKVKETIVAQTNAQEVASAPVSEYDLKIACEKQYVQDNLALINALIRQNLYYPRIAKKRGMQGKAMVAFTLNTKGEVIDVKTLGEIASILSKAAVKTIRKAAASFPHPKVDLSLQIPIVYKLAQR